MPFYAYICVWSTVTFKHVLKSTSFILQIPMSVNKKIYVKRNTWNAITCLEATTVTVKMATTESAMNA